MKSKRILFVLVIALVAVLLSGCTGRQLNNSWPGLASDGEYAYLAAGQFMYAVRLSDGQEVWRYPESSSNSLQFIAQPVIAPDGTIIIGSAGSDHRLVALDPSVTPPVEKWIFSEAKGNWVAGVLVMNDKVFAPNSDGKLYVLDLQDGSSTKSAIQKIDLGGALWSEPTTDGNLVFVSSVDHHLHAIDPETYEFAWPSLDLGGAAPGTPLVGPNGNVYIGSFKAEVVKVDTASGTDSVLTSTQGWVWGGPVTDGQNIYFGDIEGNLFAFDAATGDQIWSRKPDDAVVGSPLVMGETIVVVTESGSVFAINLDGTPAWQIDVGGQIYTTPVTGSDLILIAPMQADFQLYAFPADGSSSNPTWSFPPEN